MRHCPDVEAGSKPKVRGPGIAVKFVRESRVGDGIYFGRPELT